MAENVLVVAPHPDDEAIGCGGMICLHRQRGDSVRVVFLTSGERGIKGVSQRIARSIREKEAQAAARVLGVDDICFLRLPDLGLSKVVERAAGDLRKVLERDVPDLMYLPHPADDHPDHEASLPIVRKALTGLGRQRRLPELRVYEIWSPMAHYGWVEDISDVMPRKMRAVKCYTTQLREFRYDRAIRGLNEYRGVIGAGSRYAEAFQYCDVRTSGK
jgi:LmbE family N-acetylglucosaminyl deacetylase